MLYQNDWIMRQIETMVQAFTKLILNKDTTEYEVFDEQNLTGDDLLYLKLKGLLSENKICEAEDLLFDSSFAGNRTHLEIAFDFYEQLNKFSDDELTDANFSREEIMDGLKEILKLHGISLNINFE